MKFGRLLARLFIGAMFVGHGTQKWFGWFGGPGIEKTSGMMESLGLAPARANAHAASAGAAAAPLQPGATDDLGDVDQMREQLDGLLRT